MFKLLILVTEMALSLNHSQTGQYSNYLTIKVDLTCLEQQINRD